LAGSLSASRTATSWLPEESQVESCEHQDNADIHYQPLPEAISEEHEIHADDDGYHRRQVKYDGYLSAHFRPCPNLKLQDDLAGLGKEMVAICSTPRRKEVIEDDPRTCANNCSQNAQQMTGDDAIVSAIDE
jgi:hypothetical protein